MELEAVEFSAISFYGLQSYVSILNILPLPKILILSILLVAFYLISHCFGLLLLPWKVGTLERMDCELSSLRTKYEFIRRLHDTIMDVHSPE